jgi:hypothetical protein
MKDGGKPAKNAALKHKNKCPDVFGCISFFSTFRIANETQINPILNPFKSLNYGQQNRF